MRCRAIALRHDHAVIAYAECVGYFWLLGIQPVQARAAHPVTLHGPHSNQISFVSPYDVWAGCQFLAL